MADPGLYLYCIAAADNRPPTGLAGIGDSPVRAVDSPPFAVWASRLDRPPTPDVSAIQRHNHVVETAGRHEHGALPVRFGQWLDSEAALLDAIAERRDQYAEALPRVAGAVELGVRVVSPEPVPAGAASVEAAASGREYLESVARRSAASRARTARGRELARELHDTLGPLLRDQRTDSPATPRGLVELAHLVSRDEVEEYRDQVSTFAAGEPDLRFLVSGPWPPYSFAS